MESSVKPNPSKLNPALLVFLIFPIAGMVVAFIIATQGNGNSSALVPPTVVYTPDTLIGTSAPDFALKTPAGDIIRLSSLKGQWVFLNFWATWCQPCQEEMPLFQRVVNGEFDGDGSASLKGKIALVAVDNRETLEDVTTFLKNNGLNVPVGLDPDGAINNRYRIIQMPITYLIDPAGVIRYQQVGQMTPALLNGYLDFIRKQASS